MTDRFWAWLAMRLPRRLVFFCAMRVAVHGIAAMALAEREPPGGLN